jgi:5-bromo-4-chloroindolyl phosphate hydrolysis protein
MRKRKLCDDKDTLEAANEATQSTSSKRSCILTKKNKEKIPKRNQYKYNYFPNFEKLAEKYESFRQYVSKNKYGEYKIDWTDPHAVRYLFLHFLQL